MSKKKPRNTKSKIIAAAWKLFYEQGYEETTLEEIILESGTSKGSFYHYFDGKDALLESLSFLFDEKYEELEPQLTRFETYFEQLIFLNQELFTMIENTIAIDLLSRLLLRTPPKNDLGRGIKLKSFHCFSLLILRLIFWPAPPATEQSVPAPPR